MTEQSTAPLDDAINLVMHDLRIRTVEVIRTERLTSDLIRIVFAVEQAESFASYPMGTDEHVKIFFPDESGELVLPEFGPGGIRLREDGKMPIYRDYTVRALDRDAGTLTIEFVLHTHGVAGSWAAGAKPGDTLALAGPRGSHIYPVGFDWYLLAADDTALPALERWLEELPADRPVAAFIEVSGPDAELELPARENLRVEYLHRGDTPPGESTLIADAVRRYEFPSGRVFAWMAGEATMLKPVRRYIRKELGIAKEQVKVDGYWRSGAANHDHHDQDDED